MRHARTSHLGLSVNRHERSAAPKGEAGSPHSARWFEQGGATRLGRRADGPRIPAADVLLFEDDGGCAIATLLCFACHPDGVRRGLRAECRLRGQHAQHTGGAPALIVNGACGDVNALEHRGGIEAARRMGVDLGVALVEALNQLPAMVSTDCVGPVGVRC